MPTCSVQSIAKGTTATALSRLHTMRFYVLVRLRVSHIWRPGWVPCLEGLAHGACCLEGKFPEGCAASLTHPTLAQSPG